MNTSFILNFVLFYFILFFEKLKPVFVAFAVTSTPIHWMALDFYQIETALEKKKRSLLTEVSD